MIFLLSGNVVAKHRTLENKIIFLQQFFRFHGGTFPFSPLQARMNIENHLSHCGSMIYSNPWDFPMLPTKYL